MKKIVKLVAEIVFVSAFIFFTYFYWNNLEINKYANIAKNSGNMVSLTAYEEESVSNGLLIPISDEQALKSVKPGLIRVENTIETTKTYRIIFCVKNTSTLDYNYLTINVDNQIYKLNELETFKDETYTYLIIDTYEIDDENKHQISIWLNEDAGNDTMGKSLAFDIQIQEDLDILAMN